MGFIDVIVSGNGQAWVDNPNPSNNDWVTLNAYPYAGETLDDIIAVDQHGYSIALDPTLSQQQFQYDETWGTVTISVTFSGGTPPTPVGVPEWLIAILAKKNNDHLRLRK